MRRTADKFKRSENNPGAVINTDTEALAAYKRQKAAAVKARNVSKEIDQLKNDINDIKSMLQLLVEKVKND